MTNNSSMSAEMEDEFLLSCRCESAKALYGMVSCLKDSKTNKLQPVSVFCGPESVCFHRLGTNLQCSLDIPRALFSEFEAQSDDFSINLTTLLDALLLLGTHRLDRIKVSLNYNKTTDICKIELQDESILSTCILPGMLSEDEETNALPNAFRDSPVVARLIVLSETIGCMLNELSNVPGAQRITIALTTRGLVLDLQGDVGECQLRLPVKGPHVVHFELSQNVSYDYTLSSVLESLKGVDTAQETCISVNSSGMIAIQHQVIDRTLADDACFVDYILCALMDQDEEEEEPDETTIVSRQTAVSESPQSVAVSTRSFPASSSVTTSKDESSARIFGSVESPDFVRKRRRRRSRPDHDSDSEASLDIAAPAASPARVRTRRECSSPEVVYGQQG